MLRRLGADEYDILAVQNNIAKSYQALGRFKEASSIFRDVYSGELKLYGAEDRQTLISAYNYAIALIELQRFDQAKSLLRKSIRVARRFLGVNTETALKMRWFYAEALYKDPNATLEDLREAVTTLEDTERTARRVLGGSHPGTLGFGVNLQKVRAALRARVTLSGKS